MFILAKEGICSRRFPASWRRWSGDERTTFLGLIAKTLGT